MARIKFVLGIPASIITTKNGEKILTVSDLHVGLEYELQKLGFKVPSQTSEMTTSLYNLLTSIRPDTLVLLGDVKHEVKGLSRKVKMEVEGLINKMLEVTSRIVIVMGNHDGSLKRLKIDGVEVHEASGVSIGDVSFVHGNAWPKPELLASNALIMGHLHPSLPLHYREDRVWIIYYLGKRARDRISRRFKVDVNVKRLIVHPAYNSYLGRGSLNIEGFRKLSPIFRGLVDPIKGYIYSLDGTFIGRLSSVTSGTK